MLRFSLPITLPEASMISKISSIPFTFFTFLITKNQLKPFGCLNSCFMNRFLPLTNKSTNTRELIIEILAEQWPLTAKQIFLLVKKQFNKPITYQAVHKTIKELVSTSCLDRVNNHYSLNKKWIETSFGFFSLMREEYLGKNNVTGKKYSQCRIGVYNFPDAYYQLIVPLFKKEKILRLCSKTPALILSSEANLTFARKTYHNALVSAGKNGQPKIKYLISYNLTKKKILEEHDLDGLNRLKKYSKNPYIEIRCAPTKTIVSGAICKKDYFICLTSVAHTDSIGVIHIAGKDFSKISELYDNNFVNAFDVNDLIFDLEKNIESIKKN